MKPAPFKDKVVIITGASSGIGKELVLQLAEQGALLSLAARDIKRLEELAEKCELGSKAIAVMTDVSDEAQCRNLIIRTVEEYGRIDMLINNAGFGMKAEFSELKDLSLLRRVTEVNYYGSVYCTFYALPYLKKTKGRIVGVSSIAGKVATPGNTAYSGSKFAMAGFFDALRLELRDTGVSVTMIYPGFVVTEFAERMVKPDGRTVGPAGRKLYSGWMTKPDQCAKVIINAASRRKRQVIMTPYGVFAIWMKLFSPGSLDRAICFINRIRQERYQKIE